MKLNKKGLLFVVAFFGLISLLWVPFSNGTNTTSQTNSPSKCSLASNKKKATLPGACWRPYSSSSPFNVKLPQKINKIKNSSLLAKRVANFGSGAPIFWGGTSGTSGDYGHSLYKARKNDPLYNVHCTEDWGTCDVEGNKVRIPRRALASSAGDGHMGILDPYRNVEYNFWQVKSKANKKIVISWGGKTKLGKQSLGLGAKATAAHYGLAAGVIRPAELRKGRIRHALFMTVKCTNGRSVYPAGSGSGTECKEIGLSNKNAPAMGSHFYLDMSLERISNMKVKKWEKAILKALVKYGMYVGDTGASSNGWTLKIQSGTSFTSLGLQDPWVKLGKKYNLPTWNNGGKTLYGFDMRKTINWQEKLEVAPSCLSYKEPRC